MLKEYKSKRNFRNTPEPSGREGRSRNGQPLRFVIQKHAARRLHYDFRLELNGVLVSWAVPKGPSLDPKDKRLAVKVEDHPLEYGEFEGSIPKGQYGGGEVIIWDKGIYSPDEDSNYAWNNKQKAERRVHEGLQKGKLSLYLKGEKLHGSFVLVKIKGKESDWLLIKHNDSFVRPGQDITLSETSVVSNRTIRDIRDGKLLQSDAAITTKGTPAKFPKKMTPMLATLVDAPFSRKGWIFEPKLDGIRAVAFVHDGKVMLRSRRGLNITPQYPQLVSALKAQKGELVLDGEIVVLDDQGIPSFQLLQERLGLTREADLHEAEKRHPVVYYVFDIVYHNGKSVLSVQLKERKKILKNALMESDKVRLVECFESNGEEAFSACIENGLEGVVAKRLDGIYEPKRRSRSWLKVKSTISSEFVICGYTGGTGARASTFGALLLGQYDDNGELKFVGGVGTGFDASSLEQLLAQMKPLITKKCPFDKSPPGKLNPVWIKPETVAEIKFAHWTKDRMLRAPVFLKLRDDIAPQQAKTTPVLHVNNLEEGPPIKGMDKETYTMAIEQLNGTANGLTLEVEGNTIPFTNLNKAFWPRDGKKPTLTKRDYAIYLSRVAHYLLPHLRDRPLTLLRFPNGITQGRFYQKHWNQGLPEFVETVRLFSEHLNEDGQYILCNNLSSLLWLAQIANLEIHTWHSRINPEPDAGGLSTQFTGSSENIDNSVLNFPDFLVFDLDPYLYSGKEAKGAEPELHRKGFQKTCDLAFWLKDLLESVSLKTFVKTSGRTGLHIYVPLIRNIDYDGVRSISEIIGRFILKEHPKEVTMDWAVVKRTGKVFLDHNMNARGKTLASIYSPRVASEAPVSTPVQWEELRNVYPTEFTIDRMPERLAKVGDLWSEILLFKSDLRDIVSQPSFGKKLKT